MKPREVVIALSSKVNQNFYRLEVGLDSTLTLAIVKTSEFSHFVLTNFLDYSVFIQLSPL